jgi:hypothetical protein
MLSKVMKQKQIVVKLLAMAQLPVVTKDRRGASQFYCSL